MVGRDGRKYPLHNPHERSELGGLILYKKAGYGRYCKIATVASYLTCICTISSPAGIACVFLVKMRKQNATVGIEINNLGNNSGVILNGLKFYRSGDIVYVEREGVFFHGSRLDNDGLSVLDMEYISSIPSGAEEISIT